MSFQVKTCTKSLDVAIAYKATKNMPFTKILMIDLGITDAITYESS